MALQFPRQPEVRLRDSPLTEVICQVRFPTILRIGEMQPTELQEMVRQVFPHLTVEQGMLIGVPRPGSKAAPSAESAPTTYRFLTSDRSTILSLAEDFYALSSTRYQHWDGFAELLELAHDAVIGVYQPAHATRIGLRYVNRFTTQNTATGSVDEMLSRFQPDLTALLRADGWTDPREMRNRLSLRNEEEQLTIQTGFGQEGDEQFFILDFDYFEDGELPLADLVLRCRRYHEVVYDAFRWCVPDETLRVFGVIIDGGP